MPLLASIRRSYIPMAPTTSIAFLCLGGLLIACSRKTLQGWAGTLSAALSGIVSAYGLVEFLEYMRIPVLSLEERLFPDAPMMGEIPTGRMSPSTAAVLFLAGTVVPLLVLRARRGERRDRLGDLAGSLATLVAVAGTVFVFGYLHGAPLLYGTRTIPMAATTALAALLLGTGQLFAAGRDSFPLRLVSGSSARARLLRAFVSTAVGVVVAIDLLRVYAPWIFFEDDPFLSGVSIVAFALITGALIARVALKVGDDMDRSEEIRRRAEDKLRESEDRYRDLVEHSQELICTHDLEGRLLSVNPWASKVLGYTQDELLTMNFREILAPEAHHLFGQYLHEIRTLGFAQGLMRVRTRNGEPLVWEYMNSLRTDGVTEPVVRGMAHDITERRRAEEALTRLGMAVEQAVEAIVITDTKGRIEYVNPAFEQITGYPREEAIGQNMRILNSGKQDETFYKRMWETILQGEVWKGRIINRKKDGTFYEEVATISPVRDGSGRIVNYVAGKRDVTQEVLLQKQLQTAQRMEAVGTLAGGIAHDFNNALTGIFGFSEVLRPHLAENEQALANLDEILRCAERASTLTRQLLTYARRQIIEPVNLCLNAVITDLLKLVSKVMGERIEIRTFLTKELPTIRADVGQIEQVVMNLVLNARDAMPGGGRLLIETGLTDLDAGYVRYHPYMKAGSYVVLTVSDTGIGMDQKTQERVFEPFFTTKTAEKGTGLGLAMVYGIVKQHDGYIHLYSEPGKGTTFRIYLPPVEGAPDVVEPHKPSEIRGGTETILLAEDDESVRALVERTLTELGYTVPTARNGEDAVALFQEYQARISLAILDVVMPLKGGKEAYEAMHREKPGLKVIFMSGYTADSVHESFVLTAGVPFLSKPFGPAMLARKVREVLDRG